MQIILVMEGSVAMTMMMMTMTTLRRKQRGQRKRKRTTWRMSNEGYWDVQIV